MKKNLIATTLLCCSYFFAQNYETNAIDPNLKKNANTVLRKNHTELTINKRDNLFIKSTEVKTILTKAGDSNAGVYIPYDKNYKISNVKVVVYDEFGKKVKTYSRKDFADISSTGSSELYTDDRALVLNPSYMHHPYTVEAYYEVNTSNSAFIQSFIPYYGRSMSVESAEYKVINKSGIKLRRKITDNNISKVIYNGTDDNFSLTYQNVPAIKRENFAPNFHLLVPKVEFALDQFSLAGNDGDLTTWDSFGKWYNGLLEPVSIITPEIQKEVDALNLQGSVSEKVKTLYQYMQNKTRYVFVAMGIGGWQPMPADEVRRKGYGDCKGLTNYMRVLLKAAGIPSHYAVIYSDSTPKKFDESFPKMDGNHVILMVPTEKGNIWLENTSQKVAFNHIGINNTNRNVLLVKDNGIEIMNTPVYNANDSREVLRLKANLKEDGSIDASAKFNFFGGLYDFTLPFDGLTPTDTKEALVNRFGSSNMQKLENISVVNNRSKAQLDIDFQFQLNNHVKKMGNDMFFSILPISDPAFYVDDSEERELPLEITFAYKDDYEIEFSIPKGYQLADLPKPVKVTSDYGQYNMSVEKQGDRIVVKRDFSLNRMCIEKNNVKAYLDFRKKARNHDNTKLLITKL